LQLPAVQLQLHATLQVALPAALQGALTELYIMAALMNYFILFDLTWCFNNIQNHNCQSIDRISILFVEVQIPNGDCPTQALVVYSPCTNASYLYLYQHLLSLLGSITTSISFSHRK
jgi:hypothetical protein